MTSYAGARSRSAARAARRSWWWILGLAAAGVAGVALRIWAERDPLGLPNSDEAVLGLMTRHLLHGHLTTFIWGEAYGGPQEIFLAAPGFALFGSSWLALRVAPFVLFLATLVVVWRVGLRLLDRGRAAAAVVLFWVWPGFVIFELAHETSFYGADLLYTALLLLLSLRIVERPDAQRVGLFGLVLGLAFWETSQIVPIAVAVIAWTIWKRPAALRRTPVAIVAFVVGALPWLVWNATHHWASLHLKSGPHVTYVHRFRLFLSPVFPELIGFRIPGSQVSLLPVVVIYPVYAALLALFVYGAWRTRRRPVSLLYVTAAVFPFIYSAAAQTFDTTSPRYTFVLAPVLVLLVAQVMTTRVRAAAVVAVCCAVSVLFLHKMSQYHDPIPHSPRNIKPLLATLDRLHVGHVYADLWAAYVIDFDSKERIVAAENKFDDVRFVNGSAVLPSNPVVRWRAYERAIEADPRHGFVFFRKTVGSVPVVPALLRHGYRRVNVGPFVVLAPPKSVSA